MRHSDCSVLYAMQQKKRILIVDDDKLVQAATRYVLRDKYDVVVANNGTEATVILENHSIDLMLLDLHMRTHEEGLEYLPKFKAIDPELDVIIVSGNTELDLASRTIKAGASAYLVKADTASPDQLLITIDAVLSKRQLIKENAHYVADRERSLARDQIVGESPAIKQLHADIEKVRRCSANVIITGETGSGKELVARHIGAATGRPFVSVDSATITSTMAESILFGHEKGSFTGAHAQAKGLFEEANRGTIYFDEISNMPLEIQAKLLRVAQEKEITRLGSSKVIPLDFRIICATNKDLEKLCAEQKFKYDLFQRLNVISLRIPPLRERIEDIPLLINHLMQKYRSENSPERFSPAALEFMMRYPWPGNIRELSNLIASLCAMLADRQQIEAEDLPQKLQSCGARSSEEAPPAIGVEITEQFADPNMDFYKYMHALEGNVLSSLYKLHKGNVSQMSRELRISRSHLYSKLSAHQIH